MIRNISLKKLPVIFLTTKLFLFSVVLSGAYASEVLFTPEPLGSSQAVHGGVGLIQTPTARMADEGKLSVNYSDNEEYRFWSVSLQLFPWLESTVRYTDIRTRLYSPYDHFSGDQTYKDKGIDAKVRLLQESFWLPEISLGFWDIGGTGLFQSEYLAASKRWHDVDFHLGIGWGYLGTSGNITNPFCEIKDSFCIREDFSGSISDVGALEYKNFFKGPAALFGGVEYQTPWWPLRLKLEYEGNNYSRDKTGVAMKQDSRWNVGAVYHWNNFDFTLNYQRGNTLGFGISYQFDLHSLDQLKLDDAPRTVTETNTIQFSNLSQARIRAALLRDAGFEVTKLQLLENVVSVHGQQLKYRDPDVAINRISRVLATELPASVQKYRIINETGALATVETVVDATAFIAAARAESLYSDITSTYVRQAPEPVEGHLNFRADYRGFGFGVETFWSQMFGSPEAFFMYQGGVLPSVSWNYDQFSIVGIAKLTLLENFDKFNYKVDSLNTPLPRVRTYVREYVTRDRLTMDALFANWKHQLTDNIYTQAYAGYLETMFGGAGFEILYRPVDSNLAFGVDVNYVRQRSYENDFDFFDYNALTGFINVYWQPEFLDDTMLTFNIGQFLAKDKGVKIDFARRFNSGILVGAYAAFTDVTSAEYGEGSFTKGFYISIPFDLFSLRSVKGRGHIPWVPINRDGGQTLHRPVKLIDLTSERSYFMN